MSVEAAAQRLERAARDGVACAPVTDLLGAGDIDSAYQVHVYPGVIHGGFGPRPSTPRTATSTTGRRADLPRPKRGLGRPGDAAIRLAHRACRGANVPHGYRV